MHTKDHVGVDAHVHDDDIPGQPAFKGLQERCEKLLDKVKAQKDSMQSQFKEKLCACAGCCEGECFFPVVAPLP